MPSFKCKGVTVEFPFEPYECQRDYMSKVIECLQTGSNGILESPTGTGKTVSLLCSTLAWRNAYIATQELRKCLKDDGGNKEGGGSFRNELSKELKEGATGSGWGEVQEGNFLDRPRIIYASRTHSQLSQAVDQLKDTTYRPKVSIIGSREQLCIHPEVVKAESNATKVHMCRAKVDNRMCHFHNNLEHKKGEKAFSEGILDIEDLVKLGNHHKVCPYYMARELKTTADIIFMPYNYLLDPKARRIHGVELSGNVVIFDEAHNIERICEESASFELTSVDLASCIEETDQLLKKSVEIEELNQQFRDDNVAEGEFVARELCSMKQMFLDLENMIEAISLPSTGAGVTKPGGFIYELFARAKVTFESRTEISQLLEKMISHLTSTRETNPSVLNSSSVFQNKVAGLQKFYDVVNIVFSRETPPMSGHNQATQMSACYKVHIRANEKSNKKQRTDLWTSSKVSQKKGFVLSYWCFSPGFSMQELVSQGVRSIILTSGTLAPLTSFKSELRINFPIQLENPHVIERHQMQVGIVTRGPDKTVLNSSYQTRFNRDYILSLGNTIVNFARIVPNGLLVFFPSYPVMNHCLEIWQEDGISNRISQYKQMFVEPKGKKDFVEAMEGFYEKVQDPTLNGASFFAVCRGKVSEGLDFADMNGRAVVITGLPFPPRMDPRVTLKMQYLDEMKRRDHKYLSGQDWYRQQASRAVNQAIGRVIRHKEDYGAILLCDTRFTSRDSRAQLPLWLRPYVCEYTQFGHAVRDLTSFFKVAEKKMPQPKAKKPRASVTVMYEDSNENSLPGPSNRLPAMKARELDSHVRSLKRNRDGSHVSEAQLKSMYEEARPSTSIRSVGLLDALSHAETSRSSGTGFLFDDALRKETSLERSAEEPKKRKKIVIKQRGFDSEGDDQASSSSDVPTKKQRTGDTTMSAQAYIEEVRRTTSKESYDTFSALIRNYKLTCDFNSLVSKLADLFVDDSSKHYLFRNFYTFVRPAHKKQFDDVCQCVTGKGCGFKPEHAIPRKKLEKHKESAANKKSNIVQVTVSVASHKTEDGTATKSTASASISHLNTDSHLNQGKMQTTHNAPQASATSGAQSNEPNETKRLSQVDSNVSAAEGDSETGNTTELHPGHVIDKSTTCGPVASHASPNTTGTSGCDLINVQRGNKCTDTDRNSDQGLKGMLDNSSVQYESNAECSKSSSHSDTVMDNKPTVAIGDCQTDHCNLQHDDLDETNNEEMTEVQPTESKDQQPSKSKLPQSSSDKTSKHQKGKSTQTSQPASTAASQLRSSSIKKKQASIMDLFRREPQNNKISTPPENHKGTQENAGSLKKQVFRKVLVPETPDKEDSSDDDLDKCNASQESDISLLSTSSSDMEGYTAVITASVEKLKKTLQGKESGHSEELGPGDEIHVRKDKKSKKKLSLEDDIDNVLCVSSQLHESSNDAIGSKHDSKVDGKSSNKDDFVKDNFYKKTESSKSHKLIKEHTKKESSNDIHKSSKCEASAPDHDHKRMPIKERKSSSSKEHVKTALCAKAESVKSHREPKEHQKKARTKDIHKSHSSKSGVSCTQLKTKVPKNKPPHTESSISRLLTEGSAPVGDGDKDDFCEQDKTHQRQTKIHKVSEEDHSANPLHDHSSQENLKQHKKMKWKRQESASNSSASTEDKEDKVHKRQSQLMVNSQLNDEDPENVFKDTSKKHKKKKKFKCKDREYFK